MTEGLSKEEFLITNLFSDTQQQLKYISITQEDNQAILLKHLQNAASELITTQVVIKELREGLIQAHERLANIEQYLEQISSNAESESDEE